MTRRAVLHQSLFSPFFPVFLGVFFFEISLMNKCDFCLRLFTSEIFQISRYSGINSARFTGSKLEKKKEGKKHDRV